jgi:hypothetical protein
LQTVSDGRSAVINVFVGGTQKRLLGVGLVGAVGAAFAALRHRGTTEPAAEPASPSHDSSPETHTSPHTVPEHLEARRASEAAKRERESRESTETKFEELREEQEAEESQRAAALGDLPQTRSNS